LPDESGQRCPTPFVLKLTIVAAMSCGRARLWLWTDSGRGCADSANHITSSSQAPERQQRRRRPAVGSHIYLAICRSSACVSMKVRRTRVETACPSSKA
jgi:hypothetical protein